MGPAMNLPQWLCVVMAGGLLLIFFMGGCVSVGVTPDLPFPQAPALTFTPYGSACLTELDANGLRAYFDELAAYRQAIHRIHQAP